MKSKRNLLLIGLIMVTIMTACGGKEDLANNINIVSREDGSGTRAAFTEITGVLEKDDSGNEIDNTSDEAIIQNSTNGVITTVEGDSNSIGYISLGSISENIKLLKIDGIMPTAESVKDGSYKLSRPFNIAYNDEITEIGNDFIDFILSDNGQKIVESEGYTRLDSNDKYESSNLSGLISIAGSTSVSPVMEKMAEEYIILNPNIDIEIQATGSSAGIQSVMENTVDIGMASRELKETEIENLSSQIIAIDGIVVIINKENKLEDITLEEIKNVFIGEIDTWNKIIE